MSPTERDNILSVGRFMLVVGIIEGHEFDVSKIIEKEIHDQVGSIDTTLDFPCLLMQICLEDGVSEIPRFD